MLPLNNILTLVRSHVWAWNLGTTGPSQAERTMPSPSLALASELGRRWAGPGPSAGLNRQSTKVGTSLSLAWNQAQARPGLQKRLLNLLTTLLNLLNLVKQSIFHILQRLTKLTKFTNAFSKFSKNSKCSVASKFTKFSKFNENTKFNKFSKESRVNQVNQSCTLSTVGQIAHFRKLTG